MSSIIRLQSSDGQIFTTDEKIAKMSGTIKGLLEKFATNEEDNDAVVPLPNVDGNILRKVLEWANQHKNDPEPNEGVDNKETRTDDMGQWDSDFVNVHPLTQYQLLLAAHYLDMKGLATVVVKSICNKIKGKSTEELREIFNIPNDFTSNGEEHGRVV